MLLMCQSRFSKILHPLLQLAVLNPYITGDESRKLFAISLTAEQISQIYFFNWLKWGVGPAASNWNPANNWCHRWVKELQESIKNSMVLWKGRSQWKTKVSRSKCSKQRMQWLSISWNHGKKSKRRQPRELKHKIKEANEHKLECKPEHKANNKDQDKTSDTFRHFNFKTYIFPDQHFFASAGVWWRH